MKFVKSILGGFCLFVVALFVTTGSADAATIQITDQYGYSETILEVDSELLLNRSISTFGYRDDGSVTDEPDNTPPNPMHIIPQIEGLNAEFEEHGFPKCCNYLLFDLGPNWSTVEINSNGGTWPGRYIYLFYGKYNPDTDHIETGETATGENKDYGDASLRWEGSYSDHPDDRSLFVASPLAFVVYNNDTNKVYSIVTRGYDRETMDGIWTCEFAGLTVPVDDDYSDYYPQLIRYNNYDLTALTCWGWLFLNSSYDYYNTSWGDWDGTVSYEFASDKSAWEQIQDGEIVNGDSAAAQVFTKAIQGIGTVVEFVQRIPEFFGSILSVFPEPIAEFIAICVGVVAAVVVLKFALHVVG